MPPWEHRQTVTIPKPKSRARVSAHVLRNVSNLPVRVPPTEWAQVVTGQKRMFRTYSERGGDRERPVIHPDVECPRPCLLFAARPHLHRPTEWEAKPGVLLSHRQEPLGSITPEDVAAEGFEYLNAFRWHWKQRYRRLGWRPWDTISVIEVRPLEVSGSDEVETDDEQWAAHWAFQNLYGDWLPE